jgi:hypothetical protein
MIYIYNSIYLDSREESVMIQLNLHGEKINVKNPYLLRLLVKNPYLGGNYEIGNGLFCSGRSLTLSYNCIT